MYLPLHRYFVIKKENFEEIYCNKWGVIAVTKNIKKDVIVIHTTCAI